MKTIAIDARELGTSTGRYLEGLLNYLQEMDKSHKYLILLKPDQMEKWEPKNKNFKKVLCPHKEFTFAEQTLFLKQLKELSPDLVHFGMVQQPILYPGKTVTTIHDLTTVRFRNPSKNWLVFTIKQQVYKWVIKIAAINTDVIIVPSEYVKDDVAKYAKVNSRKITVTYEAADKIKDLSDPIEELEKEQFIMYTGRPLPHKNLYRLIAAFVILKKKNPNLNLVLAGKKDKLYEQVEKWVEKQNIKDVVFTGFVSEGQLRWLYEHTSAYIFPSLSEGFGLPGLEAMCYGAPVVSSNSTCLPEVYGDAAYYFDPLDVEDIAEKIGEVINNKNLAAKLRKAGEERVKKYSWAKMARQTLDIYKEVLGEN